MIDSTVIAAKVLGAAVTIAVAKAVYPRVQAWRFKRRIEKICREADHLVSKREQA